MDKRFAGLKLLLCGLLFTVAASAGLLDKLDQLGGAAKQQDFLPPEQAFVFSHETYEQQRLPLVWTVAEGYYLYRDKLKFESPDGSAVIGKPQFPPAEEKQDEAFGRVAIYKHELKLALPVTPAAGASKVQLKITYQGCAEDGICYPPIHQTLSLPVAAVSVAPAPPAGEPPGGRATESLDADRLSTLLANSGLPAIAATFFGFGLLLALTPCVFPMVPILSSIVVGERGPAGRDGGSVRRRRPRRRRQPCRPAGCRRARPRPGRRQRPAQRACRKLQGPWRLRDAPPLGQHAPHPAAARSSARRCRGAGSSRRA
jgi:thiol:disulfide interchange protein